MQNFCFKYFVICGGAKKKFTWGMLTDKTLERRSGEGLIENQNKLQIII